MKKALFLIGLAAMVPAAGRAAQERAPTPAPAAPSAREIEASTAAVAAADPLRMVRDRAYAAEMLAHMDRMAAVETDNPDFRIWLDNARLFALAGLERRDEVAATVDRILAQRPAEARFYLSPWIASLVLEDFDRAIAVVEGVSRNVRGVGWPDFRPVLTSDTVWPLLHRLRQEHQPEKRVRLAAALYHIGWPGGGDAQAADGLREILLEDRLRANDREGAAGIAAAITTPGSILPMIVQLRYDAVLAPGADRLDVLRRAMTAWDESTAEAIAAAPADMRIVLERAQLLRALGRDSDALAILQPFTRDIPATVAAGEHGMWLINEAAYALAAMDRTDEAVALMRGLGRLPMSANPSLIGPAINATVILGDAGRFAQALEQLRQLETPAGQYANDYGRMWIAAGTACALAGLHREAEAAPQLARLRAQVEANPGALLRALICLRDDNGAAALLVERLGSDDPQNAILALQDYRVSGGPAREESHYARLVALRGRPEVREALGRVGRVLSLPVARSSIAGSY